MRTTVLVSAVTMLVGGTALVASCSGDVVTENLTVDAGTSGPSDTSKTTASSAHASTTGGSVTGSTRASSGPPSSTASSGSLTASTVTSSLASSVTSPSSSTSPTSTGTSTSSSTPASTSSSATSASSSTTSTSSRSKASSDESSTRSTSTVTSSERSTSSSSRSSTGSTFDPGAGDLGGNCDPPSGGLPCSPGFIACGDDDTCAVPANACCGSPASGTCQPAGAPCESGVVESCNEAADCPGDEACCLAVTNAGGGTVSCQPLAGGLCPSGPLGSAQVCRSSRECVTGECQIWDCEGTVIEACSNPVPDAPGICVVESGSSSSGSTSSGSSTGGSSSSSSSFDAADPGQGDLGAACVPPAGAPEACTPGFIYCGSDTACDLTTDLCCETSSGDSCQARTASCPAATSTPITCNEAADCPTGEVCCIATNNETNGTISCQTLVDDKCPYAAIATAQICRSDNECPSGSCQLWQCNGTVIEACTDPVPALPGLCTVM